jgi:uncharacterized protein (TIGR04255 family)
VTTSLPEFSRPPVVEVVLGVEFQPLPRLGAVNLAKFTSRWEIAYPLLFEQMPLPPSPPPGAVFDAPQMMVNVGGPAVRIWRMSAAQDQLLQVQRDRLVLNWRRQDETYPHYDALKPIFSNAYEDLLAFVGEAADLGPIQPRSAEVTYVNRFGVEPDSTTALLTALAHPPVSSERNGSPIAIRMNQLWDRSIGETAASLALDVDATPSVTNGALLTFSYREALSSDSTREDVLSAMDRGHEVVVLTFAEVTSTEMQRVWGRQR